MTKKGFFKKYEYVYDEHYDCVLCPENQILKYSTTNREGYREYKSDPKICKNCPSRQQCTESKNHQKVVTRHVWEEYMERAEAVRHSAEGKEIKLHINRELYQKVVLTEEMFSRARELIIQDRLNRSGRGDPVHFYNMKLT